MSVRDKLIGSAIALMQRHGVAGTGVTALLAESGVARRSLYLNFPGGKSELVAAATATAGRFIDDAIEHALSTEPTLAEALGRFVHMWKQLLLDGGFDAGCPIVAAALGRADAAHAADTAAQVFDEWQQRLIDSMGAHGISARDAPGLAAMTVAAVEGAVVMAAAMRSTEPLDQVQHHLVGLMAAHTSDSASAAAASKPVRTAAKRRRR